MNKINKTEVVLVFAWSAYRPLLAPLFLRFTLGQTNTKTVLNTFPKADFRLLQRSHAKRIKSKSFNC